jgi:hypothetical protein
MKHALLLLTLTTLTACSTPPASAPPAGAATGAPAAAPAAAPGASAPFTGTVAETMNSGGYTYVRLQADGKDVWIAATEFPVKKDERLTVALDMPMSNFHSTTLNRDFPVIYFVAAVAREGQTLPTMAEGSGAPVPMSSHGAGGDAAAPRTGKVTVQPNAPPAGGLSIADVWARRKQLADTQVTVRGTVVKVNNEIMGRNWFHLQDGSGKADDGTNDLTVTTDAVVKIGDVVTVTGTVGIDKDFTAGYAYDVILEKAKIVK